MSFARFFHQDLKIAYSSTAEEVRRGSDFSSDTSSLLFRSSADTRRTLRIDTVRMIRSFLNETAVSGSRKAVILCDAETMTEEASNAVLKTFEEPAENSLIIMLAKSLDLLLPTVQSRAFKLTVRDIPFSQALAYLTDPDNQYPASANLCDAASDPNLSFEERQRKIKEARSEAAKQCEGLKKDVDEARAAIALSLCSDAPLDAMELLLSDKDRKIIRVLQAMKGLLKADNEHDAAIIEALKDIEAELQTRFLRELIREVLKYKAGIPEEELPLIKYGEVKDLYRLQAEHLFEASKMLRFIEGRTPLLPVNAGYVLLRSWINALRRDACV